MAVAAFFDMDRTVVRGNTGRLYVSGMRERGEIGWMRMLQLSSVMVRYKLSLIDMTRVMTSAVGGLRGKEEDELRCRCEALFDERVRELVSDAAVEAIEGHRRQGHRPVMLTAQTKYMVEPLCRHLGIEDYLCTRLDADDGVFTGEIVEPACYGRGKCHWAREYAEKNDVDLSESFFYTDSYSDLPMLRAVGHQRVVNPDPRLRLHASLQQWPILSFRR